MTRGHRWPVAGPAARVDARSSVRGRLGSLYRAAWPHTLGCSATQASTQGCPPRPRAAPSAPVGRRACMHSWRQPHLRVALPPLAPPFTPRQWATRERGAGARLAHPRHLTMDEAAVEREQHSQWRKLVPYL